MFNDIIPIFYYALIIVFLYLIFLFFFKPLKILFKIILNGAFGAVLIFAINYAGGFFGLGLGINVLSSLIVGYMGIPGALLLLSFKMFL